MFRALFGKEEASSQHVDGRIEISSEIEQLLDVILNPKEESSERRAAAYSLRELMGSERRDLSIAYASGVIRRLDKFKTALCDSENEEVAQTLLEILAGTTERAHASLLKTADIVTILMDVAQHSPFVWVKVCAIQALLALTTAAPKETVDHLQSIPSALETLVGFLSDDSIDVRNEMIVLLHKLTECSDQMRKFMTFCDGPNVLLRLAMEERDTIVSSDCLAVCLNILSDNPIGQKLFVETQQFLVSLSSLLQFDPEATDPTSSMLRVGKCVELIRVLSEGRVESKSSVVRKMMMKSAVDEKRLSFLKEVQTKLGATRNLLEHLFIVASDTTGSVEDTTKRAAICALGDLICQHSRNASILERLRGFSFLASTALTSTRWADASAAAYAWICALDGRKDGEQRAITLLGHAVAPLPGSFGETDEQDEHERLDDAASLVANALYRSVQSILALREEVYVDPSRVVERRSTAWRALHLWELLLVSNSAKELALKVLVEERSLFDVICDFIKDLLVEKDETEAVKELVSSTAAGLLRLLVVWAADDKATADHVLSSASNLYFFEPLKTHQASLQNLAALLIAACLGCTWDPNAKSVVFGLVENKWGIPRFLQTMKQIPTRTDRDCDWSDDDCTLVVFDGVFRQVAEHVIAQADSLLVRGSSSRSATLSPVPSDRTNGHPESLTFSSDNYSSGEASADLRLKYRKLEQDYAQLLLILAHQEVERQSLLQMIQDLGGKEALDNALRRSATLLAKAFESYEADAEQN